MAQKTKLINIGKSFEKLKIMVDINECLNSVKERILREKENIIGIAVLQAIEDSENRPEQVLQFIKEMALDNPALMSGYIGEELTNRILTFKL